MLICGLLVSWYLNFPYFGIWRQVWFCLKPYSRFLDFCDVIREVARVINVHGGVIIFAVQTTRVIRSRKFEFVRRETLTVNVYHGDYLSIATVLEVLG